MYILFKHTFMSDCADIYLLNDDAAATRPGPHPSTNPSNNNFFLDNSNESATTNIYVILSYNTYFYGHKL